MGSILHLKESLAAKSLRTKSRGGGRHVSHSSISLNNKTKMRGYTKHITHWTIYNHLQFMRCNGDIWTLFQTVTQIRILKLSHTQNSSNSALINYAFFPCCSGCMNSFSNGIVTARSPYSWARLTSLMRIWALWTNTDGLVTSKRCCRPSRLSCSTFS